MRLNAQAAFTGEARYYFGLPVTSGQVRWRVTREPVFPWWLEDRLPEARLQVIATGASPLGEDGTFKVAFTPAADERTRERTRELIDMSYRYRIVADVTDEGGETHSADRVFRLGWVAVEARIQADRGFLREGQGGELTVIRTDLNGAPRPGKGTYRVVALKVPDRTLLPAELPVPPAPLDEPVQRIGPKVRTPGDVLRPRWGGDIQPDTEMRRWASGEQHASGSLEHRENGEAKLKIPPLPAGVYRVEYETVDEFGEKAVRQEELIVAGEPARVPLPLLLRAEAPSVQVGEVARLLVVSGLPEQRIYVDIHRPRGIERRVLVAGRDPMLLELPIREDDRGGFSVTVTAVRDYQLMHVTSSLFVPYENKELKLELSTFRDQLRPGAKETFRVSVKGPKGARVEAGTVELLAYMYDRALDAFAPHVPPTMARLYPQRAFGGYLRSTLGAAGGEWVANDDFPALPESPELQGDQLRVLESYGVGGPGHRRRRAIHLDALAVEGRPTGQAEDRIQKPEAFKDAPAEAPAPGRRSESLSRDPAQADAPAPQLRSNFSETAFWQPRLLTDAKGGAAIEFTVPDSVTSWNVWVHGLTRDLVGGSVNGQTRSVKDLMVRPYLPRFLREGDRAELQVVLNNASERPLSGQVTLEIVDPETQASLLDAFGVASAERAPKAFTVEAGKSAHVTYPLVAPARLGQVAFKVVARSGDISDGELRPLPVLPSRMHLAQSRFAVLQGNDQRTLRFDDLAKGGDPSLLHEQLVVTLDAQLFYSVLEALPYLANFPYECTEQTLNRFVSTGIVSRLYSDYPAVARMAQQLSKRQTRLETWDAADPNRKMALEETPWLGLARGGKESAEGVVNVLDPRAADAERLASLEKLSKAQTEIGGFPWWPGGPPSPYMTVYIAHGLARAAEYKVAFPKDLTLRAWRYLAQHYRDQYAGKLDEKAAHWEFLTFLNYVATSYPDESYVGEALSLEERKRILDYSFARWKEHSPYLKGYLALTLKRMGRTQDALKVW
ncbi:MAG TPA: alpha-2-macroglobulin family protein, partial [Myxococcaceae bacterium]|nr:alpha-2-macroglobulin family protein [Myxococcaceae bacterium]